MFSDCTSAEQGSVLGKQCYAIVREVHSPPETVGVALFACDIRNLHICNLSAVDSKHRFSFI